MTKTDSQAAEIKELVFTTLGAASLCWEPRPTGVFDSSLCAKFGDELIEKLIAHQKQKQEEAVEKAERALMWYTTTLTPYSSFNNWPLLFKIQFEKSFKNYQDYKTQQEADEKDIKEKLNDKN